MKLFFSFPLVPLAVFTIFLGTPHRSQAQEAVPYLVGTGTQLELVGFPVHSPALDSGTVSSVGGTLISWSPSYTDRPFGSALRAGQEYYTEVMGPVGHVWLGHRIELDEVGTSARTDHGLIIADSPYNTRGMPNDSLVGAHLEVRPHMTVPDLTQDTIERRVIHGREKTDSFQFFLPSSNGSVFWIIPFISGKGGTFWVDQNTLRNVPKGQLIVTPGSAVGMLFGNLRGLSAGLTGQTRNTPVAKPLTAGFNFASYPFPRDMRLGQDWGNHASGFHGTISPKGSDRIEILVGKRRLIYSPESVAGSSTLRWRLVSPVRRHKWKQPAEYLDEIPVGQGFLIWRNKPDPNHFFHPPKP